MSVDLRAKPFYLDDKGVEWVEKTFASLSDREKVGQLFCEILWDRPGSSPEALFDFIEPGAVMYRPFPGHKMWEFSNRVQKAAKVPLLVACNLERGGKGGNGGLIDGTYVASPMGAAATGDPFYSRELARVACEEGGACGVNWTFEPIIDIDMNPENPITNVRTFGSDKERILANAKAYIDACKENDFVTSIKHFPGDGVDYRDQHLMSSINSLSAEEWMDTYGYLYKSLIDYGAPTVMCAHIRQPELSRMVNPEIKDEEIMPGSLSKELMQGILRERFGFNGLIITDATQMVGFTCSMERKKAVPYCWSRYVPVYNQSKRRCSVHAGWP